jgi:ABC-2 type transport system permease protein
VSKMITLIRRELIEHRSSWAVTSVFGGLFVLAAILAVFGLVRFGMLDQPMTIAEFTDQEELRAVLEPGIEIMLVTIATVLNIVMTFVVFFYFLDALYAERKDRSILFWKSLPVSDLQVVGSKYLTGIAAIPLLTLGVFLVTAILVTLITAVSVLLWGGAGDGLAGAPAALARVTAMLAYALIFQALWFAPIDGWLLLVSAYARRAVLGWALLPPLLVVVAERLLFGSRYFVELIAHRLKGGFELAFSGRTHGVILDGDGAMISVLPALGELFTPGRLLGSPATWAGLAVGMLFLAGAVWLRRWRDEA